MGIFTSCCRPSATVPTPDIETRRRQQMEAAERRVAEAERRGVKDPERVRRAQQRAEDMEKREQQLKQEGGANLKWTAN